ncbi:MAG: HD domain-containing protein [Candidatus Heimdallarchaeota archaeon]|nr:HD domain-containing protein [Candidatus Heimdallarchaeota archaeon]
MKDVHELPVRRLNFILELLLDKAKLLSNIDRDQPLEWSIMHMYSCSQLAKLLAIKRGLNPEIAGIAGAIHDLAIIETGIFKDHGPNGVNLVRDFLKNYNKKFGDNYGLISDDEIEQIVIATNHHSDKKQYSDDKFVELIKDVDSFDRYLHGKETYDFYVKRTNRVLKDINYPLL